MNPTPAPITPPVDIARLRELEAKATPGPWKHVDEYADEPEHCVIKENEQFYCMVAKCVIDDKNGDSEQEQVDADFIAALRNAAPALLSELERLRGTQEKPEINTHVRLFDLVRYMRAELHQNNLITDHEYAWLCSSPMACSPKGGSPSRERLEDYDEIGAKLTTIAAERDSLRRENERLIAEIEGLKAKLDIRHLTL